MISIIITAFKEARTIGRSIEAVLSNRINEDYEILIITPDKETSEKARYYSKKYGKIKVINDLGEGKPSALNLAFSIAKGRILFLTDGDVYIKENSIKTMLKCFENQKIGAVSGRPISLNSRKDMLGYWSHLLSDTAHIRRQQALKLKKRISCSGYLYAIKSKIIKEVPNQTLSEDGFISHLIYETGYKIDYCPEAEVYVKYPLNFKDWIKQKKRSAGGYNQIKLWIGKEIRSFKKESSGIMDVLKYPKSLKEIFYTFLLLFARVYLWIIIFFDINLRKKELKTIWQRAGTTK